MTDAVASHHPTGAFRDYFRVFERAFGVSSKSLAPLIVATCHPRLGVTLDEVETWIAARDPASHADKRRTFIVSSDVTPFLDRIEQAAYDVFLNKLTWRSASTERRELWRWRAGVGPEGPFMHHEMTLHVRTEVYDEYGVFPIHPFLRFDAPGDWWPLSTGPTETIIPFGPLAVD